MKFFGLVLLGFSLVLLALTLFGTSSFLGIALVYIICLYQIFFRPTTHAGKPLLIGVTIGLELLGAQHIGLASFYAIVIVGLATLFGDIFRFTSPFGRFIVAVLLALITYSLLLFPLRNLGTHLIYVAGLAIITIPTTLILSRRLHPSDYELI